MSNRGIIVHGTERALYNEIWDRIDDLTQDLGYAPSVKELTKAMGWKSTSTAHRWLKKMKAEGWVTWEPECPRTLRCL